ncbi:hypothetical protein HUG10_19825 (plasmid) [Halorarum halophilum]|uniref:Uncharacterized protein n=1 Tax=Halorarum halophilum TaxID=2743090 RepID=A0A7D5K3T0_9EURY|nr:hypothetical protein [Halobaculum halophilum]QLG29861.1 hypothetical protein HUG10_19825 [Halobaculum halophilum]
MRDERAAATTLGYALNLTVATLLVSGLLIAGGGFVSSEREQSVRTELHVVGQQLSGDIGAADRLARSTSGSPVTVELTRRFPEDIVGVQYYIAVDWNDGDPYLQLATNDPDVTVRVAIASRTTLATSRVQGGSVHVVYDATNDRLEVTDG